MSTDLANLDRILREDPGDTAALVALAKRVARTGILPEFVPQACLAPLVALWADQPDERDLEPLFLALLGYEAVEAPERMPPSWWRGRDRIRNDQGRPYDRLTGLPLLLRRPVDGARMVLVAPGPTLLGPEVYRLTGGGGLHTRGTACVAHLDAYYIDERPLPGTRFGAFVDETSRPVTLQTRDKYRPATYLSWQDAADYAAWVGGRLPTEAEHERAVRGVDGRGFAWGNEHRWLGDAPYGDLAARDLWLTLLAECPHPSADRLGMLLAKLPLDAPIEGEAWDLQRRIFTELVDTSPFGLIGTSTEYDTWCLDWFVADPWARAVDRNPRVEVAQAREELWTRRDEIEQQIDFFENRHEDAPSETTDRMRAEAYAQYAGRLDEVLERTELAPGRTIRGIGRCQSYSYVETCLERRSKQPTKTAYNTGVRVVRGLAGGPDALPPLGTEPAKQVEVELNLADRPYLDAETFAANMLEELTRRFRGP
jgi:formylglycine-generating enzyme required for sulfatase activity